MATDNSPAALQSTSPLQLAALPTAHRSGNSNIRRLRGGPALILIRRPEAQSLDECVALSVRPLTSVHPGLRWSGEAYGKCSSIRRIRNRHQHLPPASHHLAQHGPRSPPRHYSGEQVSQTQRDEEAGQTAVAGSTPRGVPGIATHLDSRTCVDTSYSTSLWSCRTISMTLPVPGERIHDKAPHASLRV